MNETVRESLWNQFGASLDMLDNAIAMCPNDIWEDEGFWYLAYHTLFWTDLYIFGSVEGFAPPEPFALDELDPDGILPERVYAEEELREYLQHCRREARASIEALDDAGAERLCSFGWGTASYLELIMYNMRHIQHGAAQLNLQLRQAIDDAPGWVAKARN